jgi:hypothetical protein
LLRARTQPVSAGLRTEVEMVIGKQHRSFGDGAR